MKITRRRLMKGLGAVTVGAALPPLARAAPAPLSGTKTLTMSGDLAAQMVEAIHQFLAASTESSIERRRALWHYDFSSREAYQRSVAPNRARFAKVIGLIDHRVVGEMESERIGSGDGYQIFKSRLAVLDGVDTEGLLLVPAGDPVARIVAIPDADWPPERLVEQSFARRLAENGCCVFIPTLIDRSDTWSGNQHLGILTNLPHREYIYRMSYEVGRHIIGYEVQKVLAIVDWFVKADPSRPVGVMGYGEGGLLALYSSAVDPRIDAVCVSGYFAPRQSLSQEPLYRNVWSLLREFGDAELAGLIAPRALIVETSLGPELSAPPQATGDRSPTAAGGRLVSPSIAEAQSETDRARPVFVRLNASDRLVFLSSEQGRGLPGSEPTLQSFVSALGITGPFKVAGRGPSFSNNLDPAARLHRQLDQLEKFSQRAILSSVTERRRFWAGAVDTSVDRWQASTAYYKRYLWEEIFGKLPQSTGPLDVQSRRIYDEPSWTGYEIVLPLDRNLFAYGILLLPRSIRQGERRPVVVCEHGLEGRPQDLIKPTSADAEKIYNSFAAHLADQGFVVYCPQDPFIGDDSFRRLQRQANPLKLSLYSFVLAQHERLLEWLGNQAFVDPQRIGFYGMSYGGKTAIRIVPLLNQYALAVDSGDFNEWIWKTCRDDKPFTYLFAKEYEIYEFDLGNKFNHSDMASLMIPRPFMVERGHNDASGVDAWVAYEYAKVERRYEQLGLRDRIRIEYFNGPHTVHGVGTFAFLNRYLKSRI